MKLTVKEITIFSMFGALMYASKMIMEVLPNIHLLGTFIIALTIVYRKKALYPIYIFVLLNGLLAGFSMWWIPYLYVWTVLWGATMLLPKNIPTKLKPVVYALLCAVHGFLFGTLYAPVQALMYGFGFEQTIAWIVAGFPFDFVHGVSNFLVGFLIIPLVKAITLAEKATGKTS